RLIREVSKNVNRIIIDIDSIASVSISNSHNIISAHNRMLEELHEKIRDVEKCEKIDEEFKSVEESINDILNFVRAKDMKALKRNYGAIVGYTKGYFPDIKEDNELKDEIEDGVGEVAGEIIDAGTEPKAFREVENAL